MLLGTRKDLVHRLYLEELFLREMFVKMELRIEG